MTDLIAGLAVMANRGAVIRERPDLSAIMMLSVFGAPHNVAETFADKTWTQRIITGRAVIDEFLTLSVERDASVHLANDLGEHYRSMRIDQLATSPIWRV